MRTITDLTEAYEQLLESAPASNTLALKPTAAKRSGLVRVALVAAAVVAVAASPLAIERWRSGGQSADPQMRLDQPLKPATPPPFPTAYWFGPASLPGYTLDLLSLDSGSQAMNFTGQSRQVSLIGSPSTSLAVKAYRQGKAVKINNQVGYFGRFGDHDGERTPSIAWPFSPDKWVSLSASTHNGAVSLPEVQLLDLARALVPKADDHVALVKVGYLPKTFRFVGAAAYLHQGTMSDPDSTVGTGYRAEWFGDPKTESALWIDSVYDPFVPLDKATTKTLPHFDNGPWTKTKVRGHLAWVAPHDVLIQWGNVNIDISSTRVTGNTTIPLVSKAELLKVANSLTVATSNAIGAGFPLATSMPARVLV